MSEFEKNLENDAAAEDENYITLTFDDGTEETCLEIGIFEVEGKEYMALQPENEEEFPYLFLYKESGEDEFELADIEDDDEFDKVTEAFLSFVDEAIGAFEEEFEDDSEDLDDAEDSSEIETDDEA